MGKTLKVWWILDKKPHECTIFFDVTQLNYHSDYIEIKQEPNDKKRYKYIKYENIKYMEYDNDFTKKIYHKTSFCI